MMKYRVLLDDDNCQIKNINLATQDKHSEGMIQKSEVFMLDLDKKAEKVFSADNMDAKAWIDGSPFKFTAETNDLEWKRAYLQMPLYIKSVYGLNVQFNQNLELYNKNIELHLETLNNINKAIIKLSKKIEGGSDENK